MRRFRAWQDGYDVGYAQGFWVGACAGVSGAILLGVFVLVMVMG